MTLEELVIQCKKQEAKAQGELYRRYSGILFAVCLRYSPSRTEAEDNLQDAFITIYKKMGQYEGKGSFEGWIKRITVNTVLQKYRKKRHFEMVNEELIEDTEETVVEEREIPLDYLLKMVQELPDRYRMVFSMYVLDGYPHKEIAELMGISEGTSKSNLARARNILKKKVDNYFDNHNT